MSGINPNYKGCVFCGQEECDCPYTGKETPRKQPKALTGLAAQLAIMRAICRAIERDRPKKALGKRAKAG